MYNYVLSQNLGVLRQQQLIEQAEERRLEKQIAGYDSVRLSRSTQRSAPLRRISHLVSALLFRA